MFRAGPVLRGRRVLAQASENFVGVRVDRVHAHGVNLGAGIEGAGCDLRGGAEGAAFGQTGKRFIEKMPTRGTSG